MGLDYKTAGVDKEAGYQQVQLIKEIVKRTYTDQVITEVGGFSGMVALDSKEMDEPVLVSGTDGVGTKLMIAQAMDKHDSIGIDLVAMCVNDIICQGAKPLFFLDYIATGKLDPEKMASIVEGVASACIQSGAALVGGETAEMPGMYGEEEYDLAGFAVGVVDRSQIITGQNIQAGDIAVGLASSGLHSNGFSLVRAILDRVGLSYEDAFADTDESLGEVLLTPTKIYAKEVQAALEAVEVQGIAHITGGGLYENLPRILPDGLGIDIDTTALPSLPIYDYLKGLGQVEEEEMFNTFNMGVGMVLVLRPDQVNRLQKTLDEMGAKHFILGEVTDQHDKVVLHG